MHCTFNGAVYNLFSYFIAVTAGYDDYLKEKNMDPWLDGWMDVHVLISIFFFLNILLSG